MDLKNYLRVAWQIGQIPIFLVVLVLLFLMMIIGGTIVNIIGVFWLLTAALSFLFGLPLLALNRSGQFLWLGYAIIGLASLFLPHWAFQFYNWDNLLGDVGLVLEIVLAPVALVWGLLGYATALDFLKKLCSPKQSPAM